MYLCLLQLALLKLDTFSSLCCPVSPDVTIRRELSMLESYSKHILPKCYLSFVTFKEYSGIRSVVNARFSVSPYFVLRRLLFC